MDNYLVARVKAANMAHAYATTLYSELVEALDPFMGKKIQKSAGGLLKRVEESLPRFRQDHGYLVYQSTSTYSLSWNVKTCVQVEQQMTCVYYEVAVYVGNLKDGVLMSWIGPINLRSDYTPEEVQAARERYREAKRIADDLRSALHPFGE